MINLRSERSPALQFVTGRLHVRRYVPRDESLLFDAATESVREVYPFLPWCHPRYTRDESRAFLAGVKAAWDRGDAYNFAIRDRDSGRFIGGCGLNRFDERQQANLGYWIRTAETGKGYATEATIGLARWAFATLQLRRIEIIMSVRNAASRKVAISAGAQFEGTMRHRLYLHGENHDAYLYALVRGDLPG